MGLVLIVEDTATFRDAIARRLRGAGHEVVEAHGAMSAIEAMGQRWPDVVLLDLNMPEMDGLTFLRWLRRQERGAETRVIVVSCHSDADNRAEASVLGVSRYLVKSQFSLNELVTTVDDALATRVEAA